MRLRHPRALPHALQRTIATTARPGVSRTGRAAALLALAVAAGLMPLRALADQPGAVRDAERAMESQPSRSADVLAGPSVAAHVTAPTLVERDALGQVRQLDVRPEIAAIERLRDRLDEQSIRRVEALLAKRAAAFDRFVRDNLDELFLAGQAGEVGNVAEVLARGAQLLGELRRELDRSTDERPLVEQVRELLPPEHAERYARMIDDYWDAVLHDQLAGLSGLERRISAVGGRIQLRLEALLREVELAYERLESSQGVFVEQVIDSIGATPAQAEEIRRIVGPFVEEHGGLENAPPEATRSMLLRVYRALDEPRREKLFELVLSE